MRAIVLSVRPKWASLIRSGRKTIEVRRQFPILLSGFHAYVYETSPTCALTDIVKLGAVHKLPTNALWRDFGTAACLDEPTFAAYFQNRSVGFGIEISRCFTLAENWSLYRLRDTFGFTAPQSWAYASSQLVSQVGVPL